MTERNREIMDILSKLNMMQLNTYHRSNLKIFNLNYFKKIIRNQCIYPIDINTQVMDTYDSNPFINSIHILNKDHITLFDIIYQILLIFNELAKFITISNDFIYLNIKLNKYQILVINLSVPDSIIVYKPTELYKIYVFHDTIKSIYDINSIPTGIYIQMNNDVDSKKIYKNHEYTFLLYFLNCISKHKLISAYSRKLFPTIENYGEDFLDDINYLTQAILSEYTTIYGAHKKFKYFKSIPETEFKPNADKISLIHYNDNIIYCPHDTEIVYTLKET